MMSVKVIALVKVFANQFAMILKEKLVFQNKGAENVKFVYFLIFLIIF